MAIWDIFKSETKAEERAEGRITDLSVERGEQGERWRFRLDSRPSDEFVFEPTALSPLRRRGEQVSITYNGPTDEAGPRSVERITSA